MTLGSHQKTIGETQSWITPRFILDALGSFDLDPCASDPQPWPTAKQMLTSNGLDFHWEGRVWLNPPFHRYEVAKWVRRLADHQFGIALLHARTEAEWFDPVWDQADSILFLSDRLYFYYPDGRRADANSGAPACLIAFSKFDTNALRNSKIAGRLVTQWEKQ